MANISLSTYTLRIRKRGTSEFVSLSELYDKFDFFDIFNKHLENLSTKTISNDKTQKVLGVKVHTPYKAERLFSGIFESGEFGHTSDIRNKNDMSLSYRKTVEDAEVIPFYFRVYIPEKKNEAIIILQNFKQYQIKGIFQSTINEYFKQNYNRYTVELFTLAPEQLIEYYLQEGKPKKLRYIKFASPLDIATAYDKRDHVELSVNTEFVVSIGKFYQRFLEPIQKYRKDPTGLKRLIEFKDYEYDTIKVELEINKKHRTIDLNDIYNIKPIYDITDKVKIGENQHPNFNSIDNYCKELMDDLIKNIGIV